MLSLRRTVAQMKPNASIFLIFLVMVAAFSSGCNLFVHRYQSAECKERGKAYSARVDKLKRDADDVLKLGTKKDVVLRFFQDNGIPPRLVGNAITGTIYLKGCAPTGCGSDDALLGLRVVVDRDGTVISEPNIGAFYSNCL